MAEQPPGGGDDLRERAVESLKRKSEFWAHFISYVLVNGFLIVVWAVSGAGFFWPIFPIFGWGIGIAFHAWSAYWGDRGPTEGQIRREMDRLKGEDS